MREAVERFFSVVIPTFGRPQELAICLESLGRLDYPRASFEVVVVDDGSATPLNGVVATFRDKLDITLLRQDNAGPAAARNTGAGHAKGEFLVFIDDDCSMAPDYLRRLAVRSESTPDCAIGGRTINTLSSNVFATATQVLTDYLYSYYNADPSHARFLTSNNMMVPAQMFRALDGFATGFTLAAGEDRELCDRWLHHGHGIIYAPEAVVYHSHKMTLGQYWRQHFNYGRGASSFHHTRGRRVQRGSTFEPISFYLNLLRYPFSRRCESPAILIAALVVISQAAIILGFFLERLSILWQPPAPHGRGRSTRHS
jgi:glycosyltransferase involved in cell wall biosynthesis